MWIPPFLRVRCRAFTRRVSWGEWDAPDHLCSSSWSYQGCWMCWWMLRRCPQIGSKQELMGAHFFRLVQFIALAWIFMTLLWVTHSYMYIFTNISFKNIQIWTQFLQQCLWLQTYKTELSIFCTVHLKCFNFTSFLRVYKRQFASCIIILVG